ncbi:MAG: chitobiase/beta-hexosaminidase C-terminal domain-containing protein [Ardenticatenaceae bacterium]|nr:chitobiase/beta-hexosaminidase C-terminal domain-containing protein [Anaerolineales bacterium]MCB8920327.1 chitobiase/beta-hexosaminidase C-terminal domain-containing protein [Ardenticatenaceae bacterium]
MLGMLLPLAKAAETAVATPTIPETTVTAPQFSIPHGYYTATFTVTLTNTTPGAVIHYTLDASIPTTSTGLLYTDSIVISRTIAVRAIAYVPDDSLFPSIEVVQTYIFPGQVIAQFGIPAGYPSQWSGLPADYDMDPEVTTVVTYSAMMTDTLLALPTLSIVMDTADLFGETDGLYLYPTEEGDLWERPSSAELIFPDGTPGFQINAGIQIFGGASRIPTRSPKHSFRLLFKGIYGPTKLNYDLFGEGATTSFDTLVLRAGYNNSWIHGNIYGEDQRTQSQYARDQWMRDTQLAMGQESARGFYVHLYLNGLYWGIYNLHERPDATFLADYYGGNKDEYDALNSGEVIDGSRDAWNTMMALVEADLSIDTNYQALLAYVDAENFIDFILLNHYSGNQDWDDHNWYAGRRRVDGEQFHFFVWDSERILEGVDQNVIGVDLADKPSHLFQQMRANEEFRMMFADLVYRHLFNDGALVASAASTRFAILTDAVYDAAVAESARWGDYRRDVHPWLYGPYELYTRDDQWVTERERLMNEYFPQRTAVLLQQYRDANLYPTIDPPLFSQEGGVITTSIDLMLTNPISTSGEIYYTLDGSDPRLPYGGGVAGTAVFGGDFDTVILTHTTQIKARIYNSGSGEWSALHEASFRFPNTTPILVNELLANSAAPELDKIELYNPLSETVDLSNWYITDNFTNPTRYQIPPGTVISGDGYLVFDETELGFAFSSLGEEAYLFSQDLAYNHGFEFGPSETAVSFGRYLISTGDPHFPAQSATTFGAANAYPKVGPIVISTLMYHPDATSEEYLMLTNVTSHTVPLFDTAVPSNTWQITGIGGFFFPEGTTISAHNPVLVVGIDPAAFRTAYNVPAHIQIFGPYPGGISNGGERISLQMPGDTADGPPYIVVDEVEYLDIAPWPTEPDGEGAALQRIANTAYGNDPINWQADFNWQDWPLTPTSDVGIQKRVMPETAVPGQFVTYTLTFSNTGSGTANGVVITDTLPLLVEDAQVSSSGIEVVARPASHFVWDAADMDPGTTGVITISGIISSGLQAGAVVTNTAVISASNDTNTGNNNTVPITVTVALPEVAFAASSYVIDESVEQAIVMLVLAPMPQVTVTLAYTVTGGTAVAPNDYTLPDNPLIIPPGRPSYTFTIPITDDDKVEPTETVELTLTHANGAVLRTPLTTTLTIQDDDLYKLYLPFAIKGD